MDTLYYSQETNDRFIKKILCNGDKLLYKYVEDGDIKKFRARASKIVPPDNIDQFVYVMVTNTIRDVIIKTISTLSQYMKPYGDMIITGGEAFNTFFELGDRIITSDIDTKFVPIFRLDKTKKMKTRDPKYFGYLQATKLILWDKLGQMMPALNKVITERMKVLSRTKWARLVGLKVPNTKDPSVTRRYTLIRKSKQDKNSNKVVPKNVLIDVELFAIDLKVRYFSVESKKLESTNLGGILDIAFMRPGELGYEVAFSRVQGKWFYNRNLNKWTYDKNILVASKKFLVDDLYTMQTLGLRPHKKEKDKQRMYSFAKKILKVDVKKTDSIFTIFKKSMSKIRPEKISIINRPYFPKYIINQVKNINPDNYSKYTTEPIRERVLRLAIGMKGPKNLTINKFSETMGKYRFDVKTRRWVPNNSVNYIKNEYNYRPTSGYTGNLPKKAPLYGYNPIRNKWLPVDIVKKAGRIPFVGLKNKSTKK